MVNAEKTEEEWKKDTCESVKMYNEWFKKYAPVVYNQCRDESKSVVSKLFSESHDLLDVDANYLAKNPSIFPILRMALAPSLAVDRVMGFSGVRGSVIDNLEKGRLPPKLVRSGTHMPEIRKVWEVIASFLDLGLLPWLKSRREPTADERQAALSVIGDRLARCWADSNIRNAQEARQIASLSEWLRIRGYKEAKVREERSELAPGTYAIHLPFDASLGSGTVKIPVDMAIMKKNAKPGDYPLLIEAKSAGDFTNVNKRRKEELAKAIQLKSEMPNIEYILFLCGYFDIGYQSYSKSEGMDWVWEHRIDDLALFGV